MTNYRTKTISLTLAVAISLGSLSACASTTAVSTASISEPADPVAATVTVTALSLDGATVKLPDGTEFTIPADELPDINDLNLGDEITIEYTQNADGSYSAVVAEEEAPADETEDESESASESEPTTESEPVSEEEAKAEEKTADESSKQAESAPTQSSTSAATSTASTSTASSKASESAAVSKTSTSSSKLKPELLFPDASITVYDWTTPAVDIGGVQYMIDYLDADGNVLATCNTNYVASNAREKSGYSKYEPRCTGSVKAFNDYRGVSTPFVMYNQDGYYIYNSSKDTFTWVDGTDYPDVDTATAGAQSGNDMFDDVTWSADVSDEDHIGDVYTVIELINEERAKAGLNELEIDDTIMKMAAVRAEEMSEKYEHTRPDGTKYYTVFDEFGVDHTKIWTCENGVYNSGSAEGAVKSWMGSSGHKANILNENMTKIGVGYYHSSGLMHYWTMLASS